MKSGAGLNQTHAFDLPTYLNTGGLTKAFDLLPRETRHALEMLNSECVRQLLKAIFFTHALGMASRRSHIYIDI